MITVLFSECLRWWLRQLVNALLRPMLCRWREAGRAGDTKRAELCESRFFKLLNFADCYPFCVIVDEWGLWICDEAPDYSDEEEGCV